MACKFSKQKYEIIEGCLRKVEHTNLTYVEPHKAIINNRLYLFFNEQTHFYIGDLKKKIPLSKLEDYIAKYQDFRNINLNVLKEVRTYLCIYFKIKVLCAM